MASRTVNRTVAASVLALSLLRGDATKADTVNATAGIVTNFPQATVEVKTDYKGLAIAVGSWAAFSTIMGACLYVASRPTKKSESSKNQTGA